MTWLELRDWAYQEQSRLSNEGYWTDVDWPHVDFLERWLKGRDKSIDQCIDHFLQTGEWGDLARDDRVGLFYRLCWATQILALLTLPDAQDEVIVPDPITDAGAVRRWVLIDLWEIFGREAVVAFLRR